MTLWIALGVGGVVAIVCVALVVMALLAFAESLADFDNEENPR